MQLPYSRELYHLAQRIQPSSRVLESCYNQPMDRGYFLGVVPPKKITDVVDKYRKKYAIYTSYHTPPHITVYPPFFLKGVGEAGFINLISESLKKTAPFPVRIESFDYFTGKNNVAYLKPDENSEEELRNLLKTILPKLQSHTKHIYDYFIDKVDDYHPHMTIAEAIPADALLKIKKELGLEKVNITFGVNSLKLLIQPQGSHEWKIKKSVRFG